MRRESNRAELVYEGFPPSFEDEALARHRSTFVRDRDEILDDPDRYFAERGPRCDVPTDRLRRLIDPMSLREGGDPGDPQVTIEDAVVRRIDGECPTGGRTTGRLHISYRTSVSGSPELVGVVVETIAEATLRDGLLDGPFVFRQRTRPARVDDPRRTYLVAYGAMNGETGVMLAPSVFFRFFDPGPRNHTRVSVPRDDGRHRDSIYVGGTLRETAEWRGFVLDGDHVRLGYRNAGGVWMPEERERYVDGVRVDAATVAAPR